MIMSTYKVSRVTMSELVCAVAAGQAPLTLLMPEWRELEKYVESAGRALLASVLFDMREGRSS